MKKKVILITGATGYVGCHLAYTFLKEGHHVIALVREADKTSSVSERAFEAISAVNGTAQVPIENLIPIVGDVANKHEVSAEAIRAQVSTSIDEIWHCAATFSIQESEKQKIEAINIKGTQRMLDLALQINAGTPPMSAASPIPAISMRMRPRVCSPPGSSRAIRKTIRFRSASASSPPTTSFSPATPPVACSTAPSAGPASSPPI